MLRSVKDLNGFKIVALDGEIGDVEEFYFDDERWALRYIVVNTGNWQAGRQVLVSPFSVMQVDRENRQLQVALTKSQVEKSPDIDTRKPVSRQMEANYADYYGYPYYWGSPLLWGAEERPALAAQQSLGATASTVAPDAASGGRSTTNGKGATVRVISADVHLRSMQEVSTYSIAAIDGDIGVVEDFIVEDESWAIRYLVIDTHKWLPGKQVMISPQWIAAIDWAQAKVHVSLSREGVKHSPAYDSSKLLSRAYEAQLYEHYGQTDYYWLN
jgi:PRC-barrel domain protein